MPAGQPTKKTPEVVSLLIACFQRGFNVSEACWESGISRETYYTWLEEDTEFSDRMDKAKQRLSIKSKHVLANAIEKDDIQSAKWWLERKAKDEFSGRTELTGADGEPLGTQDDTLKLIAKALLDEPRDKDVGSEQSSPTDDKG